MHAARRLSFPVLAVLCALAAPQAWAGVNQCDPGETPDIIVGDLFDRARYGVVGGVVGFAIGTESCNLGTCWANWLSGTPFHPVIAQNMYRLHAGRFEQIGMSWLKHGFSTLDDNLCGACHPADGQHLGVNCSDPYWATLNGSQGNLGPRFEVNPETGTHLHPFTAQGQSGNVIYKRMQVKNSDMDPAGFPGAQYFIEGQYVAQDDAAAGNNQNNNSYRRVGIVNMGGGQFDFALNQGQTVQQQPAIFAWKAADAQVSIDWVEGRFVRGYKVTDLGNGFWRYEFAVQNVISDRSARSFQVPLPHGAVLANVGFHDIDHHSGEPWSGTDWTATVANGAGPNTITWQTSTFAENPNANALRWGTLFNFRFDADFPPAITNAVLGLFKPGSPDHYVVKVGGPDLCGDGFCESPEAADVCAEDCLTANGSGRIDPELLALSLTPGGDVGLDWEPSCMATDDDYGIYRGTLGDFTSHSSVTCSTGGLTVATVTADAGDYYYLVVPHNDDTEGSYGTDSEGVPRPAALEPCRVPLVEICD